MKVKRKNSFFSLAMVIATFLFSSSTFSQNTNSVNWLTFDQLKDSMAVKPKKIFIDIYADWCGPCKTMDKKTFTHKKVIKILNRDYYAVKFDAERKDTITFNGKSYSYEIVKDGRGANQLALEIGKDGESLRYPTLIILNADYSTAWKLASMMYAADLLEVLGAHK